MTDQRHLPASEFVAEIGFTGVLPAYPRKPGDQEDIQNPFNTKHQ